MQRSGLSEKCNSHANGLGEEPDREQAERFLALLDPEATAFTFQTFDDDKDRKKANEEKRKEVNKQRRAQAKKPLTSSPDPFARIYHGFLDTHWDELVRLNAQRVGIFVTINKTDGRGRSIPNIKRVRALFADLDGAPLEPVMQGKHKPHIVVESSPGHWHAYWRVSDVELKQFADLQKALAARFGGDPSVHDLPRVMRLPGFMHRKGAPFLTLIVSTNDAPAYTAADFSTTPDGEERNAFEVYSNTSKSPTQRLNDLALTNLSAWVPEIFPGARPYHGGFRVSSADLGRELEEDLSIVPDGIKDFGVHDLDDPLQGKRTPVDLVMEHVFEVPVEEIAARKNVAEFQQARDWLRDRLPQQEEIPQAAKSEEPAEVKSKQRMPTVPVDLWKRPEPPTLPSGVMPTVIEEFALEQGEVMGADPNGLAMGALTVCAAVIPDRIQLKVKKHDRNWKESTRMWVALVGGPSEMKSPILRQVIRKVSQIDAKLMRDYAEALAEYEQMDKEERKGSDKPIKKRLKIEDATPEAAQEILRDNPNGVLCFRDELSGWFGSIDKYAGHRGAAMDRGFWLQAYNGGPYTWDRVTRGSGVIENLSVSILGGIQPEPLRKLMAEGVDDGLIQRLNPIMLRSGIAGKDEPNSQAADRYDDLVEQLYQLDKCFFNDFHFDDDARVIRQQLERKHRDLMVSQIINKKLAAHIGKFDGMFARFCLLWHCIEREYSVWPSDIDAQIAQRVADFMHKFLLPHAVAFYTDMLGLSDDHDRLIAVAGYILAHKLERISNRDVQRGDRTMRGLERQDMDKVFSQLNALGWIDPVPGLRFSDPPQWLVNPEVHVRFAEHAKREAERRHREHELIVTTLGKKGAV